MIHDKEVTLEYVPSPDFWYCKRCKASTGGHQSCSFCKGPKEEVKQELVSYPQPQKTSIPVPSEKLPNQKWEEGQESKLRHQKRDNRKILPSLSKGRAYFPKRLGKGVMVWRDTPGWGDYRDLVVVPQEEPARDSLRHTETSFEESCLLNIKNSIKSGDTPQDTISSLFYLSFSPFVWLLFLLLELF
uniref:Uncharacterized protein n=1 Tax=Mus spicilegus TaxID=10103 RepID=A0A8C6I5M2_MUSSI